MSEDAKNPATDDAADQNNNQSPKPEPEATDSTEQIQEAEIVHEDTDEADKNDGNESSTKTTDATEGDVEDLDEAEDNEKSEKPKAKAKKHTDGSHAKPDQESISHQKSREQFQNEVREQIDNCKFEIISALQENVHNELQVVSEKRIRKVERRRRVGFILRDILIILLIIVVGYFGYCLYEVRYFDFMKSECERNNTCSANVNNDTASTDNNSKPVEIVKDKTWYLNNYGYLYKNIQTNLNADKVSAYYLYSGDYKVSEIQPSYLLSMAYGQLEPSYENIMNVSISASALRSAFVDTFGSTNYFTKVDFSYGCVDFKFDKNSDTFTSDNSACVDIANRKITEEVTEVYEEGNALYFLTTAAIYDQKEQSFYNFDDLFKPAISNVNQKDLTKYSSQLNSYQYQFKKVDDKYYFSSVTKLK